MRVKVLQLTSAHPAKDTRIFLKTASSLAAAGYDVVLLAPNAEDETTRSVSIKGFEAKGGRVQRFLVRPFKIARLAIAESPRIVHFHDPELIFVGMLLRLLGIKAIYDVHEDYRGIIHDRTWIPSFIRPLIALPIAVVEQFAVRVLSAAVVATPTIAARFPATRTTVINNYPMVSELTSSRAPIDWDKRQTFVYTGGISKERGILQVIEGIRILQNDHAVDLALGGVIPDASIEQKILSGQESGLLQFLGFLDRQSMADLFARSIAGLVTFLPFPNHINSQPNKLFEYMSAGLPVIASNFPKWREIIEGGRCGICVDPKNPTEIAQAMKYLIANPGEAQKMGQRGQKLVNEKLNWGHEEKKLIELYQKLVGSPQRADHT